MNPPQWGRSQQVQMWPGQEPQHSHPELEPHSRGSNMEVALKTYSSDTPKTSPHSTRNWEPTNQMQVSVGDILKQLQILNVILKNVSHL